MCNTEKVSTKTMREIREGVKRLAKFQYNDFQFKKQDNDGV
jgi:hypothetical protein